LAIQGFVDYGRQDLDVSYFAKNCLFVYDTHGFCLL